MNNLSFDEIVEQASIDVFNLILNWRKKEYTASACIKGSLVELIYQLMIQYNDINKVMKVINNCIEISTSYYIENLEEDKKI